MTIGAGMAVAAVWIVGAIVMTNKTVTGVGMTFTLIGVVVATAYIAGVKP
jgi:hypothetical protein